MFIFTYSWGNSGGQDRSLEYVLGLCNKKFETWVLADWTIVGHTLQGIKSQEMRQNPGHWSWILDHISWFPCKSLCLLPKSSSTTENNIWTQYDSFRPKKSNLVWLIKRLILVPLLVFAWFPLSCPSDQKYSFQIFSNSFHYQKSFVAGYMSKGQCVQNLHI